MENAVDVGFIQEKLNFMGKQIKLMNTKLDKILISVTKKPKSTAPEKKNKEEWKRRKKLIDQNLIFIRRTEDNKDFRTFTRKKLDPKQPTEEIKKHINNMFMLWKYIKFAKEPNIYIAYFPYEEGRPIVYVGEVRKQSTGFYRRITERWGYSGHDHGAEARRKIKDPSYNPQTRIDPYIVEFDFKSPAFVLMTTGVEKEMISKMKKLSEVIEVVNK